jgi:PPK2 family polyphosphate:nucleotide phosphotransferase
MGHVPLSACSPLDPSQRLVSGLPAERIEIFEDGVRQDIPARRSRPLDDGVTIMSRISKFIAPYRIDDGKRFRLKSIDPGDSGKLESEMKKESKDLLRTGVERLCDLQERLYAQDRWALLLIFQALDAAGKDSVIKHVLSGVNPQGCQVVSFKSPTSEELDHDFMWRALRHLPERGRIGIFNRSYYEDVLIVKTNPEILAAQKLPEQLVGKDLWDNRYQDIRAIERYLARNGVIVLKFFLYVSKDEQKKRFLERLDRPEKNWKFNIADLEARERWDDYMDVYQDAIRETASPHAPWFVVPADKKWFTRLVVAAAAIDALESLNLKYPEVDARQKQELARGRVRLNGGPAKAERLSA